MPLPVIITTTGLVVAEAPALKRFRGPVDVRTQGRSRLAVLGSSPLDQTTRTVISPATRGIRDQALSR